MQNAEKKLNLFDRFIDQFSVRELSTRVWVVVAIGFALMGAAVIAGWFLLTHDFYVADEPGLQSVEFIRLLFRK